MMSMSLLRTLSAACVLLCAAGCVSSSRNPDPADVLPTPEQTAWQKMEYYMFVHFGPNTFTGSEWGSGEESPEVFDPAALDCRQWAATARAAGMK
ncbi:MAG: glycoside hydrolase family 29 (alpha-L-fucosidase), partial [Alistipes sp.]|nr:glycoside hydrolase family 29 (alpha-L-fucosidase) [Alistipes sp.]